MAPTSESATVPLDIATMRETAARLLEPEATAGSLSPAAEVDTLADTVRGHLELIASEVEQAVRPRPKDAQTYCALACVGEARRKLGVTPGPTLDARVVHARRLARVLNSLCDHYERFGNCSETREQAAIRRLGNHSALCPTCRTLDDDGANANLPCTEADRLYDAYRQSHRGEASPLLPPVT